MLTYKETYEWIHLMSFPDEGCEREASVDAIASFGPLVSLNCWTTFKYFSEIVRLMIKIKINLFISTALLVKLRKRYYKVGVFIELDRVEDKLRLFHSLSTVGLNHPDKADTCFLNPSECRSHNAPEYIEFNAGL